MENWFAQKLTLLRNDLDEETFPLACKKTNHHTRRKSQLYYTCWHSSVESAICIFVSSRSSVSKAASVLFLTSDFFITATSAGPCPSCVTVRLWIGEDLYRNRLLLYVKLKKIHRLNRINKKLSTYNIQIRKWKIINWFYFHKASRLHHRYAEKMRISLPPKGQ